VYTSPLLIPAALALFLASSPYEAYSADGYTLRTGNAATCSMFLKHDAKNDVLEPQIPKSDARWQDLQRRCPAILNTNMALSSGLTRPRASDYAIFSVDVDNDGRLDTVLFRRFDYTYYAPTLESGLPVRRPDGRTTSQEFLKVNLETCETQPVFFQHNSIYLIKVRDKVYVRDGTFHDSFLIYREEPGKPIMPQGAPRPANAVCWFVRTHDSKREQ